MDVETIWEEYGFGQFQEEMDRLFPTCNISFPELMQRLMRGEIIGVLTDFFQTGIREFTGNPEGLKSIFIWLIVLGILSSLMGHLVEVFDRHQVAELSFYVTYLLVSAVLLRCFTQSAEVVAEAMENIALFCRLLIPAYLMAVGVAGGAVAAGAYYQLMLILLGIVQEVLTGIILPLVYSYAVLGIVNGVWVEEKLTLLLEYMEKAVKGILKAAVWLVTGLGIFQSVLTPVMASFQNTMIRKAMGALPGIGDAAEGVLQLTVGAAVVVKNSMGLGLLILLCFLCLVPLLRVFLMAAMLKGAAAFMSLVSHKRITNCTDLAGNSIFLLLRLLGTALLLFFISITIIAVATNKGY